MEILIESAENPDKIKDIPYDMSLEYIYNIFMDSDSIESAIDVFEQQYYNIEDNSWEDLIYNILNEPQKDSSILDEMNTLAIEMAENGELGKPDVKRHYDLLVNKKENAIRYSDEEKTKSFKDFMEKNKIHSEICAIDGEYFVFTKKEDEKRVLSAVNAYNRIQDAIQSGNNEHVDDFSEQENLLNDLEEDNVRQNKSHPAITQDSGITR